MGPALCEAWSERVCAVLSEGRLDEVLVALWKHDGNDEALRCAGHVKAHRARMRYPAFRAAGLAVGSCEVEAPAARWPDASGAAACAGASTAARTPS